MQWPRTAVVLRSAPSHDDDNWLWRFFWCGVRQDGLDDKVAATTCLSNLSSLGDRYCHQLFVLGTQRLSE